MAPKLAPDGLAQAGMEWDHRAQGMAADAPIGVAESLFECRISRGFASQGLCSSVVCLGTLKERVAMCVAASATLALCSRKACKLLHSKSA
jgi:hypothetical protein